MKKIVLIIIRNNINLINNFQIEGIYNYVLTKQNKILLKVFLSNIYILIFDSFIFFLNLNI
jgi:hypothetical protein